MAFRLLLATRNQGKVAEFRRLFDGIEGLELIGLDDVAPIADVVEDGDTFEQNAHKKAVAVARASGLPALADDSGLEVDALDGAPGVHSARFAGPAASDSDNNRKLLSMMADVPDNRRAARFRCVLVLVDPGIDPGMKPDTEGELTRAEHAGKERTHAEHGVCEGRILRRPRGTGGFGYDPVFLPKNEARSMAEFSPEEKNRISHRARAAARMRDFLAAYLPKLSA